MPDLFQSAFCSSLMLAISLAKSSLQLAIILASLTLCFDNLALCQACSIAPFLSLLYSCVGADTNGMQCVWKVSPNCGDGSDAADDEGGCWMVGADEDDEVGGVLDGG
jgi:hypothetical protein